MDPSRSRSTISHTNEPSLTHDVVKLLADELQRVRNEVQDVRHRGQGGQASSPPFGTYDQACSSSSISYENLRALQAENARIRTQIDSVKARLEELPLGPEGIAEDHEERNDQLNALNEAAMRQDAEYERTRSKLLERLDIVRAKYRKAKTTKSELHNSIAEEQMQLDKIAKTRSEDARQLAMLQRQLKDLQDRSKSIFDFRTFLQESQGTQEPVELSEIVLPTTDSTRLKLPEALSELCVTDGYVTKYRNEVVWPPESGRTRCLFLAPTHHYDPTLNDSQGAWEPTAEMAQRQKTVDLFLYQRNTKWCYLGIFQYVGNVVLPMKEFDDTAQLGMQQIYNATMLHTDQIPPVLTGMVKNMYKCGVLKAVCTGWRRVGFNQKLAEALRMSNLSQVYDDAGPSATTLVPKGGFTTEKRSRADDEVQGPSHKKNRAM